MKKTALSMTTAALLALTFAGASFAEETPSFEEIDVDKNGMLSKSEAATVEDLDFAAADANKDGVLSRPEYEAAVS